jgi:hypothetical protein
MDSDFPFDEVVLVEMPSESEAERLWLRLHPARMAWVLERDEVHFVAAVLRTAPGDLASLLRELEAWVAESGTPQVRFELDGRTYSLRGSPAYAAATFSASRRRPLGDAPRGGRESSPGPTQ